MKLSAVKRREDQSSKPKRRYKREHKPKSMYKGEEYGRYKREENILEYLIFTHDRSGRLSIELQRIKAHEEHGCKTGTFKTHKITAQDKYCPLIISLYTWISIVQAS